MDREVRALSQLERRSWERVGRVLVPGNATLPRYDYAGVSAQIPTILAASSQEDEVLIRLVVLWFGFLPLLLIGGLLKLLNAWAYGTKWAGTLPRLLLIGIKGVIYTSYYAGVDTNNQVHSGMEFALNCEPIPELLSQQSPMLTENQPLTAAKANAEEKL